MASEDAPRDNNFVPAALFEIDGSNREFMPGQIDQATGRILTTAAGGTGTVTSVSVVSANGFAGTVATATTTPAITISTTINSPVLAGNGTAISAATTTGSGSTVVLNNSPTFVDDITLGGAGVATGSILFKGTTSGTLTLSTADAAGTWTMKLPTSGGSANQFLQTDGSGNTTWATPSGTGDVVGPASATDNAVARFDTTTGKLIQNSAVLIADTTGVISGTQGVTFSGSTSGTLALKAAAVAGTNTLTLPAGTTDFSATGGAGQFVKQNSAGGAFTVSTVAASELSGLGTGVATALAVNVGTAGAFVVNGGALGTPSSGTVTNLTGTASININGTVGATTPTTGAFTTLTVTTGPEVLGHTASLSTGGVTANLQQYGTTAGTATQVIGMFNATAGTQAEMQFYRSKNAAIGSATVVASGDGLGKITWYGAQQTGTFATQTNAAQIRAEVDGTVTSGAGGDMPGRIIFATTPDASGTLTDRLILDSAGILKPNANDGVALGTSTLSFSDLFLASGGVINWNNGNATLTHSTGLITSNVAFSVGTSNAITTGTIELGAASDTTLSRSAAGVLAVEGVVIPSISSTNTLTNKRITPRVSTTTSSGTPTINTDNVDMYGLTAQAVDITSFTTNLSGTPTDGQKLWIYIVGTAARAITWGSSFEASTVALPTTTVSTNRLDVGFVWNAATSKWRCVASA